MKTKKALSLLLAATLLLTLSPAVTAAESTGAEVSINAVTPQSGTTGGVTWELDAVGLLTLRPTDGVSGTLASFTSWDSAPWYLHRQNVTAVKVLPGVKGGSRMVSAFSMLSNATSIDCSGLDTSGVTDMSAMFSECSRLTSLDLSGFDTSKVTTMQLMFADCVDLTSVNLSSFDTAKVTSMNSMFKNCARLTSLDLLRFNTAKVYSMYNMFADCHSLTSLDLSSFDTTATSSMFYMFEYCTALKEITLGAKFAFRDDAVLPAPSGTYNTYFCTGKWQAVGSGTKQSPTGVVYAPADVPSNVAETYVAETIPLVITPVGTARALTPGTVVTISGLAMTNSTDENPALAFTDCIYVQDSTGGIKVTGLGGDVKIKAGQSVRVTGVVKQHYGDVEIEIAGDGDFVVTDETVANLFPPAVIYPSFILMHAGQYVRCTDMVTRVETNTEGKITAFWINIDTYYGPAFELRVIVDENIGYATSAPGRPLEDFVKPGACIYLNGFSAYDELGPHIRLANRTDIGIYDSPIFYHSPVTPSSIVESLQAYLSVDVRGRNLENQALTLTVYSFYNPTQPICEPYAVTPGANRIYIPKAPAAGLYIAVIRAGNAYGYARASMIEVLPYNPATLWEPVKTVVDGYLAVRFGETISFNEAKKLVTVDGKTVNATIADDGVTLITDVKAADVDVAKCVVVVKGLKYQRLFPSYSFTFTIK